MGADGSLAHPYFRSFVRQLKSYERPSSMGDMVAAAALAEPTGEPLAKADCEDE